jgi:hypothetical protein
LRRKVEFVIVAVEERRVIAPPSFPAQSENDDEVRVRLEEAR